MRQGWGLAGGDALPDCDSPCSASEQQQLAAAGDGPAAAALARRKGATPTQGAHHRIQWVLVAASALLLPALCYLLLEVVLTRR